MVSGGGSDEWVHVQKNTFTRWANTYLSRKRMQIEDLYEDLSDGIRLIALLQIICREKVCKKFIKKPKMRIQKMENLNLAFAFLQKKNVNLTNIGSSDILDGNQKIILGLMWTLIKSFQVSEIDVDGVSGKDGLLLWVNRSLADYPQIQVKNFSSSWSNGLAFCALIHRFYPNLIPNFDQLNTSNAHENVTLAFQIAQDVFKIPQLLNVDDVAGQTKPDEKSIMTYVSLLFKEFASGVQKKKAFTTISKAINIAQRHQDLSQEYALNGKNMAVWLEKQIEIFKTTIQPRRLQEIKETLSKHMEYKNGEKPIKDAEFVALESCANRWISSCKTNQREKPLLDPPIEQIQELKNHLDQLENQFEIKLRQNLENFQQTEILLRKILQNLEKIELWAQEKKQNNLILFTKDFEKDGDKEQQIKTTQEAEEKLESLAFMEEIEVPRYRILMENVVTNAEKLSQEHSETTSTLERVHEMEHFMKELDESRLFKVKKHLEKVLKAQMEVDAVVKEVKILVRNLKYAIEEIDEEMENLINQNALVSSTTDTSSFPSKKQLLQAKETFEKVIVTKIQQQIVEEKNKIESKKDVLETNGRLNDVLIIDKLIARVDQVLQSYNQKNIFFEKELENVEKKEKISKQFAQIAIQLKENCQKHSLTINSAMEGTSLNEQLNTMRKLKDVLYPNSAGTVLSPGKPEVQKTNRENQSTTEVVVVEEEEQEEEEEEQEEEEETPIVASEELVQPKMDELEKLNDELESLQVYSNPFTTDTIHGLRAQYNSLENALKDKVKSLEKEIALSQLGNLTSQQVNEIREVFSHFDFDHDGVLAREEFIMACKGLGLALSEEDCHDSFDKMDQDENDEISFDEFMQFCAEQLQSGSSKEDVKNAFEILTQTNLTLEKIEEHFEPSLVEFVKKHLNNLTIEEEEEDKGEEEAKNTTITLDFDKFTSFVFSL